MKICQLLFREVKVDGWHMCLLVWYEVRVGVMGRRPEQASCPSYADQSEWITAMCLLHFVLVDITEAWGNFTYISGKKRHKTEAS